MQYPLPAEEKRMEQEEDFVFDTKGNIHLQFMSAAEWANFRRYCVAHHIPFAGQDRVGKKIIMSRESFEKIPPSMREAFRFIGAKKSAEILAAAQSQRSASPRPSRPAPRALSDREIADRLMSRVE